MNGRCPFDVIAIHGKAGSGKSFIADFLAWRVRLNEDWQDNLENLYKQLDLPRYSPYPVDVLSLAGTLKEYLFSVGLCSENELVLSQKTKELRSLFTSTADMLKKQHGEDFFCKSLFARMILNGVNNSTSLFIISDLREEHELKFLQEKKAAGYFRRLRLITIHAPRRVAEALSKQVGTDEAVGLVQSSHRSEVGLDHMSRDKETAEANGFIWFENDIE